MDCPCPAAGQRRAVGAGAAAAAAAPAASGVPCGRRVAYVDATVVDSEGRQVTDLKATEFQVEVDGDARPVVSAEYVKLVDDTPVPVGAKPAVVPTVSPDEAFFSTNTRARRSRPVHLAAGRPGQHPRRAGAHGDAERRQVRRTVWRQPTASGWWQFHKARWSTSRPTTNVCAKRLLATVGLATPYRGRYHISLSEAIATVEHSDVSLRNQLILRECGGALLSQIEAARCEIEVEQEASEFVTHQRLQTQASLRGMREVLRSLAALEGPKSVILISEGLVLEGLGTEVDEIAAIAADVRASLDVMLLDVPSVDVTESQRPTTPREDRDRQVQGSNRSPGCRAARCTTSSRPAITPSPASCDRCRALPARRRSAAARPRRPAPSHHGQVDAPRRHACTHAADSWRRRRPAASSPAEAVAARCARRSPSTTCRCGWRRGRTRSRAAPGSGC